MTSHGLLFLCGVILRDRTETGMLGLLLSVTEDEGAGTMNFLFKSLGSSEAGVSSITTNDPSGLLLLSFVSFSSFFISFSHSFMIFSSVFSS